MVNNPFHISSRSFQTPFPAISIPISLGRGHVWNQAEVRLPKTNQKPIPARLIDKKITTDRPVSSITMTPDGRWRVPSLSWGDMSKGANRLPELWPIDTSLTSVLLRGQKLWQVQKYLHTFSPPLADGRVCLCRRWPTFKALSRKTTSWSCLEMSARWRGPRYRLQARPKSSLSTGQTHKRPSKYTTTDSWMEKPWSARLSVPEGKYLYWSVYTAK